LSATRDDILTYCREQSVAFREDASNADPSFTRNRIRHELLPRLETDYNPAVRSALLRLASIARDAADLHALADARMRALVSADGDTADLVSVDALNAEPPAIRRLVVSALCGAVREPGLDHVDRVLALAEGGASGSTLELPGGLRVTREHDRLRFHAVEPATPLPAVALAVPGATALPDRGQYVEARLLGRRDTDLDTFLASKGSNEEMMDADRAGVSLHARTRRDGDRFYPLGAPGERKLKHFLGDRKVPVSQRARVLLIASHDRIVWVVGHRLSEHAKITERTERVLHLRVLDAR
jgi:tRNA(Ile)-lysidine synthase